MYYNSDGATGRQLAQIELVREITASIWENIGGYFLFCYNDVTDERRTVDCKPIILNNRFATNNYERLFFCFKNVYSKIHDGND